MSRGPRSLSPKALERLARPPTEPLRPPPPHDRAAVERWRSAVHTAWLEGDPPAEECGHVEIEVAGVRCLRARPESSGSTGAGTAAPATGDGADDDGGRLLVIYAHGGGYALGSPEVAVPITERLAAAGLEVISVDYRLAPEHPYPAGLDDVDAVYRAVTSTDGIRRRGGRATVIVAGDSAGANLALGVVLRSIVSGTPRPIGLVLFSPHLDHALTRLEAPVSRHPRDDVDDRSAAWLRAAYIGHRSPADPGVSPLRADLAGLCPILIQVGSEDIARPHGEALSRRARAAGVEVTLEVWPGLWHTWHYHRGLPEADEALARAARWIGALAPDRGGP